MAKATTTSTTTRKTTTAKTTTTAPKAPASKTTAAKTTVAKTTPATSTAASAPKPVIVTETSPTVVVPELKKKELIELVVEGSGIKKKDAKPVIETMLEVLGDALSNGRELNLQPFGKVKINRAKDVQGGKVLVTRIRQSNRAKQTDDVEPSTDSVE